MSIAPVASSAFRVGPRIPFDFYYRRRLPGDWRVSSSRGGLWWLVFKQPCRVCVPHVYGMVLVGRRWYLESCTVVFAMRRTGQVSFSSELVQNERFAANCGNPTSSCIPSHHLYLIENVPVSLYILFRQGRSPDLSRERRRRRRRRRSKSRRSPATSMTRTPRMDFAELVRSKVAGII